MRLFFLVFLLAFVGFSSVSVAEPPASISVELNGITRGQVFESFENLESKFGKEALANLEDFDFKANVLVWVVDEFDADAKAVITEVGVSPDDKIVHFRVDISPGHLLHGFRTLKELDVTVLNDSPCNIGPWSPHEMRQKCAENLAPALLAARKRIVLLSTPRNLLEVVKIKTPVLPPKP